jgi:glutathione S-transferase
LSQQLGDKAFFLGDAPRTIDATVYAFLLALLVAPFGCGARDYANGCANLTAYVDRVRQAYFAAPVAGAVAAE